MVAKTAFVAFGNLGTGVYAQPGCNGPPGPFTPPGPSTPPGDDFQVVPGS